MHKIFIHDKRISQNNMGAPQLMMRWIWTSVVRPKLTYACAIWAQCCEEKHHTKLNRLQRLALLQQGQFRKKTPGAALEVIADTPPLHLYLEQESVKASLRLYNYLHITWSGLALTGPQKGHIRYLRDKLEDYKLFDLDLDRIAKKFRIDKLFHIDQESFELGNDIRCDDIMAGEEKTYVYTDGSRMEVVEGEEFQAGAGFVIMSEHSANEKQSFALGERTVFMGEICAIREACKSIILNGLFDEGDIVILCDSQAAIKALDSYNVTSKLVDQTIDALNMVVGVNESKLPIRWIKAHAGHDGNEIADEMAKLGAQGEGTVISLGIPKAMTNKIIKDVIYHKWNTYWQNLNQCRQTKMFFPSINSKGRKLYYQSKRIFSMAVRWITGHNYLKRHNWLLREEGTLDNLCRLCELAEETSSHLAAECPALWRLRWQYLGYYVLDCNHLEWDPKQLCNFMRHPFVYSLENTTDIGQIIEQYQTNNVHQISLSSADDFGEEEEDDISY
jgi:ribonuclease HI